MSYLFYLGDYTDQKSNVDAPEAAGIYSFSLSDQGRIDEAPRLLVKTMSPSYFAQSADRRFLYTVEEPTTGAKGAYSVYECQPDHSLKRVSMQTAPGDGLCHISLSPDRKFILGICYMDGTVQVLPLSEDGELSPLSCLIRHIGSGPNKARQSQAHTHSTTFTPDGGYAIVCDLGMDMLAAYRLTEKGQLQEDEGHSFHLPGGCGPRHMVFSPDGKFAYVACELSSEVMELSYDTDKGFALLGIVKTVPETFTREPNYPAAIRITKDGRHLYVSNRGEDSISLFYVDKETGLLTRVENVPTMGRYPRDFILTRDEKFVLAPNQESGNLTAFCRDEKTGKLTRTDTRIMVKKPICLIEA